MLLERKNREDAVRFYHEAAAEDIKSRQRAAFEARSINRYQAGEIKRRAEEHSKEAEAELESRKAKLSKLLKEEEQQYSIEIENCVETPTQRRLRLKERLNELKEKRQEEHDTYVTQKMEDGWRQSCDPLRHQVSEELQRSVMKEREQQMIERDRAKMTDDVEEQKYAEEVKKSTAEWYQRLDDEKDEKRMKIERNRRTWINQIEEHKKKDVIEKQKEYEESLQFRTTVEGSIKQAQDAAEKKAIQQAERRKELDILNTEQISRKKQAIIEDKKIDATYASKAAEELRQQEEDELVNKIVAHRKAEMNRKLLETQLNKKAASDLEAEEYLARAQEEANDTEEAKRIKDAEARRKLMLESVDDRISTIKLHEIQKLDRKGEKLNEGLKLEEDIKMEKQRDIDEREERRLRIENQYQMLQRQSALKAQLEQKQRNEEKRAVNEMIDGWKREEDKIQDELKNPHLFVGNRFRGFR